MKHYHIAFGVACAGLILSGCSAFDRQAEKPAENTKTQAEIRLDKDLSLAKILYEKHNNEKAFEIFLKYADQGNSEAEAWVGRCYMNGIGTQVNYDKAFEYYLKAAAKNNPWGMNGVGVCKQYGLGTNIDLHAALDYFKKASAMGFKLSILNLARTYADADSGFQNEKLAEEYFKKAVSAGADGAKSLYADFLIRKKRYKEAIPQLEGGNDYTSLFLLAKCYENGWGVNVNIKKSLDLYERSCKFFPKSPEAARSFYIAGLEGIKINKSSQYYQNLLKKSADMGNIDAQLIYAAKMENAGNHDAALRYYKLAADRGSCLAQLDAGKMFAAKKDFANAIKYMTLATLSKRTERLAVDELSRIYSAIQDDNNRYHWDVYGTRINIPYNRSSLAIDKLLSKNDEDIAQGAAWMALSMVEKERMAQDKFPLVIKDYYEKLRTLADKGNGNALFALGVYGCDQMKADKNHPSIAIGIELLEKAAKQNNAYACQLLGNLYNNGVIAKKDLKKAIAWYRKGADLGNGTCALSVAYILYYEGEFNTTSIADFKKAFEKCIALKEYSKLFEYGRIMELKAKNLKKAEELYRLAAKKGDSRAMVYLYDFLKKSNAAEAINYLRQAIDLKNAQAHLKMGDLERARNNQREAFAMYMHALCGENAVSMSRLAECWLTGCGCEPNTELFWWAAEEAYKNGSAAICLTLGNVFRDGKICPKDIRRAETYYKEGVKRGNPDCKKALSNLK
ncbi:MAG: sel1 repeat family protein [Lentisphaeria bacterium]|nr:sel1 repeat family protein [Lentisphaeria bacterium]MBQ7396937.1 sel1 repeat family protein [Lentisphaeria bacterium]